MTNVLTQPCHLHVTRERRDGVEIVGVDGDLDIVTTPRLERHLLGALGATAPPQPVVLDCTGVTFICSQGLGLLAGIHERAENRGTPLHLIAPQHTVRRHLESFGLGELLRVHNGTEPTSAGV